MHYLKHAYTCICMVYRIPAGGQDSRCLEPHLELEGHQQSGECIYMTEIENIHPALFCILILGFAYYIAYICNDLHIYAK